MIDWARIAELQSDLGVEDFEEVTNLFIEEVDGCVAQLKESPPNAMADKLHFLKGCAANLGFTAMQQTCETMEVSGDQDKIPHLIEVYDASKEVFMTGIAGQSVG